MSEYKENLSLNIQKNQSETFKLSNTIRKYINKILNEEMKLNFTKFITPYRINLNDKKYLKVWQKFKCIEEFDPMDFLTELV